MKPLRIWKEILRYKRSFFEENSYTEIRKTYFLAPKLGVNLYTGSTYTRVNTVKGMGVTGVGSLWSDTTISGIKNKLAQYQLLDK